MASSRRFIRCPNCRFEHLEFGRERLGPGSIITIPWNCPVCHWQGELLPDRTLTKEPPSSGSEAAC
jgi:hypothetical protein